MAFKPGDIVILSIHGMIDFEVVEVVDHSLAGKPADPDYPHYRIIAQFTEYGEKRPLDQKIRSCSASNLSSSFYRYFDRRVQTFYPDVIYHFCKSDLFTQASSQFPHLAQPNPIGLISYSEVNIENQLVVIFQGTGNPYYGRATNDYYWYVPSMNLRSMSEDVKEITGSGTFSTQDQAIANFHVWLQRYKMNDKHMFYDIASNVNKTFSFLPHSDGPFSVTNSHNNGNIVYVFVDNEAAFKNGKTSRILTGLFVVRRFEKTVGVDIIAALRRVLKSEFSFNQNSGSSSIVSRVTDFAEFPAQDFNQIAYQLVQKLYAMFDGMNGFDNDDDGDDNPDVPYNEPASPRGKVLQYASKNWLSKVLSK